MSNDLTPDATEAERAARHPTQRLRHEIVRRTATVREVIELTPRMRRVVLEGPELEGYYSPGFDDHTKLFFDQPVAEGEEPKPAMRDYTPLVERPNADGSIAFDFALHEHGPASDWARHVAVGDSLRMGGPRGSVIIADSYDWFLMLGDETALPAIRRRLSQLKPGMRAIVRLEVADAAEEQPMPTAADLDLQWIHRDGVEAGTHEGLARALAELELPAGEGHGWIACEALQARALRALLEEKGHPAVWLKASGYWTRGAAQS